MTHATTQFLLKQWTVRDGLETPFMTNQRLDTIWNTTGLGKRPMYSREGKRKRMISEDFKRGFRETFRCLINLISLFLPVCHLEVCSLHRDGRSKSALGQHIWDPKTTFYCCWSLDRKDYIKESRNDLCPKCRQGSRKLWNSWKLVPLAESKQVVIVPGRKTQWDYWSVWKVACFTAFVDTKCHKWRLHY